MKILSTPSSLEPFVKEIFLLESDELNTQKKFPFYADGNGINFLNVSENYTL